MEKAKFIPVAIFLFVTLFTAKADRDRPVRFEQLPDNSKEFIRKHFSEENVSFVKKDIDFLSASYEVFLVDGSKVEFDGKGEWEKVECVNRKIPDGIVPGKIVEYVEKSHPGLVIVKIERDRRDYEIELNNDLEIKFDMRFNVTGYDD
ncbi:MAG: PepSY-like domain-containing protein [Tannerella sp.]|jgi:hypothetical protein|nr:PepSY-like domain-containing protein [Tannerella sp.]